MGLREMARFWKDETKIPDAISSPIVSSKSSDNDLPKWRQALAGDERPPRLSFSRSQSEFPDMDTWWDIDSMICKANCLSIMREGIDISYHPQSSRNIHKDLRVTVNGRALHKTVHLRLGSGRRTPELGIYIYFPNILMQTQGDRLTGSGQYKRRSTYLTNSQHEVWVDKILRPALHSALRHRPDIVHHYPRSWRDAYSKMRSHVAEAVSEGTRSELDAHFHLPSEFLGSVWRAICRFTTGGHGDPELTLFHDPFIVINGKDMKLVHKNPDFVHCRNSYCQFLQT